MSSSCSETGRRQSAYSATSGGPDVNARLGPGEIHLWTVDDRQIRDPSLLSLYRRWLETSESDRCRRFRFPTDAHQYLVTRALLRFALSTYVSSIAEAEWRFVANAYGRPKIANDVPEASRLQFNLSHTRGLVTLALCLEGELGVDVEFTRRQGQTTEIAEQFFSPREVAQLHALPRSHRRDRFFDFWTLKESYIKARGMGLSIPLDSFSFHFPGERSIALTIEKSGDDSAAGWRFWQLSASAEHKLAVAFRSRRDDSVRLRISRVLPGAAIEPQEYRLLRATDWNS